MGKGQVRAEDLHRALDAEIGKLQSGSDWTRLLDVAALFPTYGFGNIVLIDLQMPHASWVANAETWKKLGRHVKSEQAIRILRPTRSRTSMAGALAAAGRKYGDEGLVEQQVIGFHVAAVYDITATAGPPIHMPRTPSPANVNVAQALWAGLEEEAAAHGFTVEVSSTGDGAHGRTDYRDKRIVVADHLDEFRTVARLMHEVGHVRMHAPDEPAKRGDLMCRGLREVEAESLAYVVLAHHGIGIEAESFDYIVEWAKLVDPAEPANVIKTTGARIINHARQLIQSTDAYLKVSRTPLEPVPARPLDSAFLSPDVDGPAL